MYVLVTGLSLFGILYPVWRLVFIIIFGIFGFMCWDFSCRSISFSERRCSFKSNLFSRKSSWNGSFVSSIFCSGYVVMIHGVGSFICLLGLSIEFI